MFDDDGDLDDLISQGLKSYAGDAAADRQSVWPRVRSALHQGKSRRRRRISRFWLIPGVLLPLAVSAGSGLALYSHTSPIAWVFQHPIASRHSETVHVYYPPPKAVSLSQADSLLNLHLLRLHGGTDAKLKSIIFQGATTTNRHVVAPSDRGLVMLTYEVGGQTVVLTESNARPGSLTTRLKGSTHSEPANETISVLTLYGSTYQVEQNANSEVLFVEWKSLSGVLLVLNGGVARPLALSFVESLLPQIH